MKIYAPSYYPQFHCLADRCRHSCCIGWEIAIDPASAALYRTIDGTLGQKLRTHIHTTDDGTASFSLTADERCPFLTDRGLCELIEQLGDDALCQICADHPRFYHTFSDRIEIGLGLCCEAAAVLILHDTAPFSWIITTDDAPQSLPTPEECRFFEQRQRLFALAEDRALPLSEREDRLLQAVGLDPTPLDDRTLWRLYEPLERLDDAWTLILQRLLAPPVEVALSALPFERLLVYFLYRHTAASLEEGQWEARVAFAVHSTRLLKRLCRTQDELFDIARLYSSEIEYSDCNPEILFDAFDQAASLS